MNGAAMSIKIMFGEDLNSRRPASVSVRGWQFYPDTHGTALDCSLNMVKFFEGEAVGAPISVHARTLQDAFDQCVSEVRWREGLQ
jgi:hypothetical protein